MRRQQSLEELWASVATIEPRRNFDPVELASLPGATQRYFTRAIAPGTPLASAVRLKMHGEIKLKRWYAFCAEQVMDWGRGMIWQARVRVRGLTISGSDRFLNGSGAMQWKLFGLLPFIHATGPDITRSAGGRVNIESLWLPSALLRSDVEWTAADSTHLHARFKAHAEIADIDYTISETGELKTSSMRRWGNPDGGAFRYVQFGGLFEQSATFDGYTIPSRVRVGWHFGTERFGFEGEFFRATIDDAVYR